MDRLIARALALLGAAAILASACGGAARGSLPARSGTAVSPSRVEIASVDSETLGRQLAYAVYVPAGYDSDPGRRYPTLYLLHGMDGSFRQWLDLGVPARADAAFRTGGVRPFLIVMPEGERGYWMDQAGEDAPRWATYLTHEVVGAIDARYRTMASRDGRAIGGLSMGAHGALQLSLNHPDEFSVVGAHSPALRRQEQAPAYFGAGAAFRAHDPVSLFAARADVARTLKLWIDIGDKDPWAARAEALHDELVGLGIPHEWRETPGEHANSFWSAQLDDYLRFYGEALAPGR